MLEIRKSIFSEVGEKLEKNKITKRILVFIINIGVGDFIYRKFSKKFLQERTRNFELQQKKIKSNIDCFYDDYSKEIYKSLIKYRCMRKRKDFPIYSIDDQYFPKDVISLDDNEVFVDCGAYIGDTIEKFLKETNYKYNKIIGFEPDVQNFKKLEENLSGLTNKFLYNSGVYSSNMLLHFDGGNNGSSKISKDGNDFIDVKRIDDIEECENATFIKMDVEGSELEAIKGAKRIIQKNKPKLAICIYHSDQDFLDIIEYIHNLVPEYKIYIRQHSIYETETVIYCII